MTPSQLIVSAAMVEKETTDRLGRKLKYRRLLALDRARLFKAAGAQHAQNAMYLGMAMVAVSCTSIDGIPQPFPTKENEIDAAIARLGDEGLDAIADGLVADDQGANPSEPSSPALAAPLAVG